MQVILSELFSYSYVYLKKENTEVAQLMQVKMFKLNEKNTPFLLGMYKIVIFPANTVSN